MDSADSFHILICSKASPQSKVASLHAGLVTSTSSFYTLCGPLPYCLKDNVCDLAKDMLLLRLAINTADSLWGTLLLAHSIFFILVFHYEASKLLYCDWASDDVYVTKNLSIAKSQGRADSCQWSFKWTWKKEDALVGSAFQLDYDLVRPPNQNQPVKLFLDSWPSVTM